MKIPATRFIVLSCLSWPAVQQAVELDKEAQERIDLHTAAPEKRTTAASTHLYATVLSPAPLIDLYRQSEAARAAAALSKETLDRAEKLFASGELVARKDVDAARGQQIQNESQIRGLEDRIALEWGSAFAARTAEERTRLITALLEGKQVLARLAVPGREWIAQAPSGAALILPGKGTKPVRTTQVYPSTVTDPVYQAQTFLALFDAAGPMPPPGAVMPGTLELPGAGQEGLLIPEDAAVLFQGRAWVYRVAKENDFERIEFSTDRPAEGGWWIAKDALEDGKIVVHGAQSILAKEVMAAEPTEGN